MTGTSWEECVGSTIPALKLGGSPAPSSRPFQLARVPSARDEISVSTHPKKSMMSTSKAFKLLHMDLFGPTTYTSIGGNKYGFVIVDDFTRYTWLFFFSDKSDTFATFKSFVKRCQNEFESTIKKVSSDNGSEFRNTRVDELCDEFGIKHQFSAKYTPQSNDLVERKNRILIDMQGLCLVSTM